MSALAIIMVIVHVILAVGVIFFSLQRMQKNAELGGAFGGGASQAHFGREKGLDTSAKWALWLGIFFMLSCFLTTMVLV
ncbi:preprotein translocase subunit SecG [Oceanotoga sp. DSM 15011]|jgi:preprotein translocase subunit SecG|uniref:Protein-export membrane protein SecG n=1 Tax=Oceanotoga teriensis TaxID=515440 RepID=A0AA45C8F9_9BACT|nr:MULTISPECIES: preprotein translocase subunit SecG [Oceanotoga]MDN5341235.1 preprotein translocase subunit SecG [Oceanotoga sp.]MDO7977884.1 preprotein translocase subunit SecG [Oceanotoga teriensis]PWJ95995.1 protein translocase subunit secG [Oceanotoga teriensis]UYP00783.1 preprotein translocase subunit SecG [Oceanotoga sp. DSM 15011]